MDAAMLLARLIHVVGGVFWVGAMIFVTFFLMPAFAEAGPDAQKVMNGITKRRYVQILPAVAVLVILWMGRVSARLKEGRLLPRRGGRASGG